MTVPETARPCPVCGRSGPAPTFVEQRIDPERLDKFSYASRKEPEFFSLHMVICPDCDAVFADRPPAATSITQAYEIAAFDTCEEEEAAAETYAAAARPWLAERSGAALEIGCGSGAFLRQLLKGGYSPVIGFEPSRAAIAAAAPEIQPLIRPRGFVAEEFAPNSFAVVACFQTLEHVWNPKQLVAEAMRLLQPGGIFLAVVHNRRALINRILGRRSPIIDIEHLQLFSPVSIANLLRECGFSVDTVRAIVNQYPLRYWLRLLPVPGGAKKMLGSAARALSVENVNVAMPVGNILAVGRKDAGT